MQVAGKMDKFVRPIVIGVAGGSGSGKTTLVARILAAFGSDDVIVVEHDSYYRDRGHLPDEKRPLVNYDHPDALETDLLVTHLAELREGRSVQIPMYDFATHTRAALKRTVHPRKVIVVEGILILVDAVLRELMDIKIFVDTDADIRFIRRLERDVAERGRSVKTVVRQYLDTVKPMHFEFVEPSKRYADLIVPTGGLNRVAADIVVSKIRSVIDEVPETGVTRIDR